MSYVNNEFIRPDLFNATTGTSALTTNPVVLYNIHVVVATATEDLEIRDGVGGTLVLDIKVSTAINTNFEFPGGLYLDKGIHITRGSSATGTLRFDYSEAF
tara:strand:+ start:95 stop:397 length:303 start_codon:yes stop_codon:yes gene_type:complete